MYKIQCKLKTGINWLDSVDHHGEYALEEAISRSLFSQETYNSKLGDGYIMYRVVDDSEEEVWPTGEGAKEWW